MTTLTYPEYGTLTYAIIALLTASILVFLLTQPTDIAKWIQKKVYHYQVTMPLYMLTPTEQFIFNSILFLFTSMIMIAIVLYLPSHIALIAERTYYYWGVRW